MLLELCPYFYYMEYIIIVCVALGISFLGQIVLSNMNIAATQLSVQEGFKNAWLFGLGVATVEIIYLRLSLTGTNFILAHRIWFIALGWLTVIVFFALGVLAFIAAKKQETEKKGILLKNNIHRYVLGLSVSALNPVQIPFWFLWSTQMIQTGVLPTQFYAYNLFCIGAGLGTLAGMGMYIHGGNWLISKMKTSNKTLNKVLGIIFIVTAFIQLYRMLYKPWI